MPTPWISALNTPWPFFGLTVPAVTYLMAGGTVLIGVGFGVRDFIKANRLSKQLTTLNSALRKLKKPVTQETMEKLQNLFSEDNIFSELRECWGEFKETLLSEKLENGDVVYTNTLQAEQLFTTQFIFRSLPPSTKSLPGIATGLGLLGTFVALLCGLAELHMADAGAVSGIGPFINALSGKFFSSIAGLVTAIGLTIYINTIRKHQLEKNLHTLQHRLNILFPRKSAESILLDLRKELIRIDKAVGHLAIDLAAKLPEVIQNSLGGDMQSLLTSINNLGQATEALKEVNSTQLQETLVAIQGIREGVDKLHSQNNDAITESIRGMMEEFKQGLHQSASTEMQQLTENLGHAAQFLQGMEARSEQEAERLKVADERLNQLIEAMQAANQDQQDQVNASTEQMNALLQQVVEQANQLNQKGKESIQEQMQQLLAQSEKQGQEWRQQMQELVSQTLGQFQSGSQNQMEQLAKQSGEMAQRLDNLLTRLDETGQQQQAQSQQALTTMREQLEESTKAYNEKIQQQQSELNVAIEQALTRLSSFMETRENNLQHAYSRLEYSQQALAETLSSGSQELGQTVNGLKETLSLSKQSMEQLSAGQKSLSGLVDTLQSAQQALVGGMKDANATANTYQQAIGAMQALHNRQSQVYGELESKLTVVLSQINNSLEQYAKRTNDGLSHNLKEWDKQLSEASRTFAGVVSEVKDSADMLAEAMEDLAKKMPPAFKVKEVTNV